MDTLALYCSLHPEPSRAETDAWWARVLAAVRASTPPSRAYNADELALWATQHGYARSEDLARLAGLCNDAAAFVPAGTALYGALTDAAYAHGARNPTT